MHKFKMIYHFETKEVLLIYITCGPLMPKFKIFLCQPGLAPDRKYFYGRRRPGLLVPLD